jgi:small-conductance mechanosensitive channel/flagellar hook-basal body complex protein FliE
MAGGLVDAGKALPDTKIIPNVLDEKQELLQALIQEKATLDKEKESSVKSIKSDLEENKNKWAAVQRDLQKDPDDQFLNKKRSLLTELHDTLDDLLRIWENLPKKIGDAIAILDKYVHDVELKEYKKDLKLSAGPHFFEDLEDIYQKLTSQQKFVDQLKKRKEALVKDQKNFAVLVDKQTEEYKDKKSKQEEFSKTSESQNAAIPFGMTVQQRAEILSLEGMLAKLKKELAELQLKEKKYELTAIENELFVESLHLDVLQDIQRSIRSSITVTSEQIESANQQLEKKKQTFSLLKTRYSDEISKLRRLREEEELKLRELSKRYEVPLGNELDNWSWQPKKTLESYVGLCDVGLLNTYVRLIDDKENLFATLIALEQEKINFAEEVVKIKETYYKVTIRKFASEDEITQEIKKYSDRQAAHETAIKSYRTKKDEIDAQMAKLQNEVLDRVKKRKIDIQQQKDSLFRNHIKEFAGCLSSLDKAEEYLGFRIDIINAISKAYTEIISTLEKIAGYSRFILTELESITIWYRPEYAITWPGIQNIGSDVKLFLTDVKAYISQFGFGFVAEKIAEVFKKPIGLLTYLLKLAFLIGLFFLLRAYSLRLMLFLRHLSKTKGLRLISLILALCVGFLSTYAVPIVAWLAIFLALSQQAMPDPYLYVLFYLLSIPFLLYLAHQFIQYLVAFNKSCEYCLLSYDFYDRFIAVFSTLLYATIGLMFARQALMLVKLPKSELPSILLAINFIIFQIALVFLISKDMVLSIIPGRWDWIYKSVNRYYYALLICLGIIIVLSNPYIGYGRLVLYLLQSVIYSLGLLWLLMKGHALVKKGASHIFFSSQDDIVRERFAYAKTWFGIAIIISFLLFGTLGLIFGAKIWGWPVGLKEVIRWINVPLFGIGKGTSSPLTLLTIGSILLFVVVGFALAYGFNKFVLEKIFDLMLVDAGVQHAVTSLVRYVLVAASIVLALQSVGYGGLVTYLYVLILGIGYIVRDPLYDLIAYFIILLQRPIKIGDYIQVDKDTLGVVRKITPKSVMLRNKNSTTIVVPNSLMVTKSVVNWNYSRNFIAFDDIVLTITYAADPIKVKELLFSVVDSHPNVLKTPKPVIRLEDFKDHGFEFMVRGFISSNLTMEKWEIASDVRLNIVKTLRQHNIELAVPVRIMITAPESIASSEDRAQKVRQ